MRGKCRERKMMRGRSRRRGSWCLGHDPEVGGGEEEESICSQTKKRAAVENKSSLVTLMKEVQRAEEDERREMDSVQLINQPAPKPWVPLRELKEDVPYPIISAREHTNKH
ncbi:uncharacterized protein LOC120349216, partial [Nilaparvata lugens]